MITEDQVVEAYRHMIRCKARHMVLDGETDFCRETEAQREERMDAICESDTLALQYLAQHVR